MKKIFNKIPLWILNALSFISAIITIGTTIFALSSIGRGLSYNNTYIIIILLSFIFLLVFRMKKYQKLAFDRQQITSFVYHQLTHISRDLYFDVMKNHKEKNENIRSLTVIYQNILTKILSHLCDMIETYCGQEVTSCIKLIAHPDAKLEEITLQTFCRSDNSETTRGLYERQNETIKLIENTDFKQIVDPNSNSNLNYFYQGDLIEYEKELQKNNLNYDNSNTNWKKDYTGTIVVPIQIENKRLYDTENNDSYRVIAFLCVDSKSSSAFLKRQERANVDMLKSFADLIYILLSQYQHYLKKMTKENK